MYELPITQVLAELKNHLSQENEAPILAVRLQELFGLNQTPAIIRDSFPLLLHFLSPASRPIQVTQDLASFWENTYNDVKKELRGTKNIIGLTIPCKLRQPIR